MNPKQIGISAIVAAAVSAVIVATQPDTAKMVAASAGENDQAVAKVVQTSGMNTVSCCRDWADVGKGAEVVWLCTDTGYDPTRIAWLNKVGADKQCVEFAPSEKPDGNVDVTVTLRDGTPRARPPEPAVQEERPASGEVVEKP